MGILGSEVLRHGSAGAIKQSWALLRATRTYSLVMLLVFESALPIYVFLRLQCLGILHGYLGLILRVRQVLQYLTWAPAAPEPESYFHRE